MSKKESDKISARLEEVRIETEANTTADEHKAKRRKIAEEVKAALGVPVDEATMEKIVDMKLKQANKSDSEDSKQQSAPARDATEYEYSTKKPPPMAKDEEKKEAGGIELVWGPPGGQPVLINKILCSPIL